MSVPLTVRRVGFLRTLVRQVRIRGRVLELLSDGPVAVQDLLAEIGIEAAILSQRLAVLRSAGVVTSTREGGAVRYALTRPDVTGPDAADLIHATHSLLDQTPPVRPNRSTRCVTTRPTPTGTQSRSLCTRQDPPAATSYQRRVRATGEPAPPGAGART